MHRLKNKTLNFAFCVGNHQKTRYLGYEIQKEKTMTSLEELQRQKDEIEKKIQLAKKSELAEALKTVKRLCKQFGFSSGMLRGSLSDKIKS